VTALRDLIDSGVRPILTGEAPTVDAGPLSAFHERIEEMAHWVDAMNATDNTAAHAHASNVAVAIALRQAGVDPILQVVCRDKNRLAIQADIVGAALHGVENVCCLTGDDVTAGDEPEAKRVFDLDGPQLVRVATALAGGQYLSGRRLEPAPRLLVGAVETATAPPLAHRAERAAKKIEAGARFLQLQISYHPDRLEDFVAGLDARGLIGSVALLPTIVLVKSSRSLRFMDEHVPGIAVPEETIGRIAKASDESEAAYELALEQARQALELPGVRGLHLTDFRHDGAVGRLCRDLGIPNKEEREAHAHRSPVTV
jgi:methylenetetrahydrofolate reductase (NADPH)